MATKYEVEVVVDADAAVRELDKLKKTTEGVASAAKTAEKPMAEMGKATGGTMDAAKKAGREMGMMANSVAEMGYTALSTIPQTRQLGMSLAMAGGSAVTMGAALGPLGVGLAFVGNLLPGIIASMTGLGSETRSASYLIDRSRASIASLADTMREAQDATNDYARAVAGLLPLEEQQIRLRAARERVFELRARVRRAEAARERLDIVGGGIFAGGGAVDAADEQLRQLRNALRETERQAGELAAGAGAAYSREQAERAKELAEQESNRARAIRDMNASQRQRVDGMEDELKIKREQIDLERRQFEMADMLLEKERARVRALNEAADAEQRALEAAQAQLDVKTKREQIDREAAAIRADEQGKSKQLATEEREEQERRTQIEEDRIRITTRAQAGLEGVLDIAQRTAQIQRETNASFGEAFKTAVDEWLKGFALQEAYKGVAATAEAIGSAVTNQPNAAAKFAEAGIHFALAAAAGGASAAIPNAGGGGGGGGGRRQGPEAVGGGASGGGGGTVVVNFNAPVSEAEIGRQQERAARAARRRFGS